MGQLEGKSAVILGAASEGNMGQTIARLFAHEGAKVMV
ncbi:MAG: oxidoreductase, partial [Erythrobacter sp.]|nr:oxidoreductase [Erythrobacter sp.]